MKTTFATLSRGAWARAFFAVFAGLFVLSMSGEALAVGKVIWKSTTIKERTKKEAWHLDMQIHLPRPPDIAHKSMKFEFTQVAHFERSLVDGREDPVTTTQPLRNQQPIIETVTVGFMDPGSGQVQSRTRFSFKVTRAHGYQAGKWKVKIRDTDSGNQIGHVATLTLSGDNPVIDRRSIVFQGKKKKEKPEAAPEEESAPSAPVEDEGMYMGEDGVEDEYSNPPPSVDERPGGGCHAAGPLGHGEWVWMLAGFLLGLAVWARRRA